MTKEFNVGKVNCDDNSAVCQRFGVKGYPTLILFSKGSFYKFQGPRSLDDLLAFATGGFKSAEDTGAIPPKLEGMDLYKKHATDFLDELARAVDALFERFNLTTVPRPVRYGLAGSIFALPIALMFVAICCMGGDDSTQVKPAEDNKPPSKKREKVE